MLPFALKLVWCVLCTSGTIGSWMTVMALGSSLGSMWASLSFCIGLTVWEGMFCLGMIWRMDPLRMPRAFCVAQTVLMEISIYVLGGLTTSFCIATSLHILKPKKWGDVAASFRWRSIYIIPAVVYPVVASAVQLTLVFKFDAIHPTNDMHCDATGPLWVRLVGHTIPLVLVIPSVYLSLISMRRVVRTLRHVERARCDDNELLRQMRRERRGHKTTEPAELADSASRRQSVDPAEAVTRLDFCLPFFRHPRSSARPPTPGSVKSNGEDYRRTSVASSSFPTFAPIGKPSAEAGDDIATVASPWLEEESNAPTSNTGHEELELDVKTHEEDDEVTYRLGYRERAGTPSKVSHLANVPAYTPQIQRLLVFQVAFPFFLVFTSLSSIIDVAAGRTAPTPFGTHHVVLVTAAWGPALTFGSLQSVRRQIRAAFWRR
ncbi:hypothetical protein GGX14DRAFT_636349 [Mycena pura]|uniref:Uncharacterized protein n=1 Tax=Mycena pura TaxID=153505 RepID=A0AAD6VB42_9AGAR|nr:hypothetical protein GGX14DRAFT_636349 [Mycena pura]